MRILFVGSFENHSTNIDQARGISYIGHTVYPYDYRAQLNYHHGDTLERDTQLADTILNGKYDLTIFSKCNNMSLLPIAAANKVGKSCFWFMDWAGNLDQEAMRKVTDCSFCCFGLWGPLKKALPVNPNSFFVEQCVDILVHTPPVVVNHTTTNRALFIGNVAPHPNGAHEGRMTYVKQCPIDLKSGLYGWDHCKATRSHRLSVNFVENDAGGTSVRFHKLMAAGALVATQPWDYMEASEVYNGVNVLVFNTPKQLSTIIESLDCQAGLETACDLGREARKLALRHFTPTVWATAITEAYHGRGLTLDPVTNGPKRIV